MFIEKYFSRKLKIYLCLIIVLLLSLMMFLMGIMILKSEDTVNNDICIADANSRFLMLVNYDNPLPEDYTPDLTPVADNMMIDSGITDAYNRLIEEAKKDGVKIYPVSAFRSQKTQEKLFKNRVDRTLAESPGISSEEATEKSSTIVAKPGTSEHQTGLAVDFNSVEDNFAGTKEAKWLEENACKFGFILRYPKDKTEITRVIYEPWHYRYIGTEHAARIKETGMCFEEYIEYLKNKGC